MNARRAALTLLGGTGTYAVLGFVRSILLARLLTVVDFGIAATFLIVLNFLNGVTKLGLQKMQVQNRAGDDPDFVAALKGVVVARNLILSVLLFAVAGPSARLMGQGDIVWAYQLLALQPLILAFLHPDVARLQRKLKFRLTVLTQNIPVMVSLVLLWPSYLIFGDFRVSLVVLLAETMAGVVISHILAERPFRIGWNGKIAMDALRFGLPLLGGTVLGLIAIQGDRIVVANQYGAIALGLISATVMIVRPMVRQLSNTASTFFLPLLARVQDDQEAFRFRASFAMQAMLVTGMGLALVCALILPWLIPLIYGEKYIDGMIYTAVIGLAVALQAPQSGINITAIARAQTSNQFYSNAVRAAAVPVMVLVAQQGGSLLAVLSVTVVAQVASTATAAILLWRRAKAGNAREMALPYALTLAMVICLMAAIWQAPLGLVGVGTLGLITIGLFAALVLSCRVLSREGLAQARRALRRTRRGRK